MAAHNELGKWGEQIAADFLESKGWYIRHHDWEYGNNCHGLVCIDSDMTVLLFVIVCTHKRYSICSLRLCTGVSLRTSACKI